MFWTAVSVVVIIAILVTFVLLLCKAFQRTEEEIEEAHEEIVKSINWEK